MTALRIGILLWLAVSAASAAPLHADSLDVEREIRPFVRAMADEYGVDATEVERLLEQVRVQQQVIDAISRPAEAKPWRDYRRIFLTERRIEAGAQFWDEHADALAAAESRYGVPASVITAIIGVETFYGRHKGSIRVIDSLATLAFRYPRRSDFFRRELEQYVLLAREERLDALGTVGSYAGAMGVPQFIPSSYRSYAVDFDGDHVRDLLGSVPDAIGSVANYLGRHGWRAGEAVAFPARVDGTGYRTLIDRGLEPTTTVSAMRELGVEVDAGKGGGGDPRAALFELDGDDGPEHWVGLQNFYVITRYNHSKLYAMAVHQLSRAIEERRQGSGA